MAYNNNYSFKHKFINGVPTKWFQTVLFIGMNPNGVSKKDILNAVWPERNTDNNCPWKVVDRGYQSSMFAQLNESGLAHYNCHDHKWHIGPGNDYTNQWKITKRNNYESWLNSEREKDNNINKSKTIINTVFANPDNNDIINTLNYHFEQLKKVIISMRDDKSNTTNYNPSYWYASILNRHISRIAYCLNIQY